MKYPYSIEYIYSSLVIVLPKGMEVVASFLVSDVQRGSDEYYLAKIDRVLNGGDQSWTVTGNSCRIEIQKDKTRIIDYLGAEVNPDDPGNEYVIETEELRELIET